MYDMYLLQFFCFDKDKYCKNCYVINYIFECIYNYTIKMLFVYKLIL